MFVGDTLVFNDVSLMIRKAEVIPVDDIVFAIYYQSNNEKVASVHFSLIGEEIIGSDSAGVFTVDNVTDTSNLPYRSGGGYGYGYGYGSMDLTVIYNISYLTQAPGKFYAKLFVYSTTQVYDSGNQSHLRCFQHLRLRFRLRLILNQVIGQIFFLSAYTVVIYCSLWKRFL